MGIEEDNEADADGCDLSCLVAVGHLQQQVVPGVVSDLPDTSSVRPMEFSTRLTLDGKFSYVDQRCIEVGNAEKKMYMI
jgi:aryl hydrocarbon receptor nuclear translocator-like protein 1